MCNLNYKHALFTAVLNSTSDAAAIAPMKNSLVRARWQHSGMQHRQHTHDYYTGANDHDDTHSRQAKSLEHSHSGAGLALQQTQSYQGIIHRQSLRGLPDQKVVPQHHAQWELPAGRGYHLVVSLTSHRTPTPHRGFFLGAVAFHQVSPSTRVQSLNFSHTWETKSLMVPRPRKFS